MKWKGFKREELMHIPEKTELPPKYVQEWKQSVIFQGM